MKEQVKQEDNICEPEDFRECCFDLRIDIENLKHKVKKLNTFKFAPQPDNALDTSEIWHNLQIVYRHLEDARMRVGKAIQAYDGGESCYPR